MFKIISDEEISSALSEVTRQYLAGDLKRPQKLREIKTDALEIGITDYAEFSTEDPHRHSLAVEYQYVMSGWTQYLDTETHEVFDFYAGDFYAIFPGTAYAQKSKPGTKILFIKTPSINDKELVDILPQVKSWMETPLKTVRLDYFHDAAAPAANSVRPAAAVAVEHDNKILMVQRSDNGKWSLPGGTLEHDESLPDCAMRELREETGLKVDLKEVVGTYTDPDVRIAYSDGEVRREFTVVYYGTTLDSAVVLDSESTAYSWIAVEDLEGLEMAESQKIRVRDLLNYVRTGVQKIG